MIRRRLPIHREYNQQTMVSPGAAGTASGIRRSRWIQIAIVLASSAVALLLAEWVVRLTGVVREWHPAAQTAILQYHEDPNGPAYLTPNWEGYVSGAWTKINADGFRDVSHAPVAQPGVLRLAVVGDSYTMGDGVALKDTYIKQLQTLLAPRFQIEVLNCGVTSTNSMNQLAALPRILARYRPALVITAFNVNDFEVYAETRFERMRRDGGRFTVHDDGTVTMERHIGLFGGVKEQFREHSYLYRLASELLPLLQGERQDVVETVRSRFQTGASERSIEALIQMRDLVEASHARFLVALIPGLLDTPASVTNMKDYPYLEEHHLIWEKLASRGVGCVDLAAAFGDTDPNGLIVHRTNRHYNKEGHLLVAKALGNYLEAHSEELLSNSSTADGLQLTDPGLNSAKRRSGLAGVMSQRESRDDAGRNADEEKPGVRRARRLAGQLPRRGAGRSQSEGALRSGAEGGAFQAWIKRRRVDHAAVYPQWRQLSDFAIASPGCESLADHGS